MENKWIIKKQEFPVYIGGNGRIRLINSIYNRKIFFGYLSPAIIISYQHLVLNPLLNIPFSHHSLPFQYALHHFPPYLPHIPIRSYPSSSQISIFLFLIPTQSPQSNLTYPIISHNLKMKNQNSNFKIRISHITLLLFTSLPFLFFCSCSSPVSAQSFRILS